MRILENQKSLRHMPGFGCIIRVKTHTALLFILLLLSVAGCSREPETGPGEVRWDREICARCKMAVSDRHYSAQIRGGATDQKLKLYKFDDIGCAVIWLDKQPWKDDPRTEIWVTDYHNGLWIDAKQAAYVKGKTTPMDYGLGAQPMPVEGALNYEQAKAHIYKVEKSPKRHGGQAHSMHPPVEQ